MTAKLHSSVCKQYGAFLRGAKRIVCAIALTLACALPGVSQERITIAALGDSLTQGYGLLPEQGFVPQLENWLKLRGFKGTILNAGVSGDTTAGGLARAAWTLTPDVDALIVTLGGNDLLRGLPTEVTRQNLEGILQAAGNLPVLLIGIEAPGNYGLTYKAEFEAIFPELAKTYDTLLVENFFAAFGRNPAEIQTFMQMDGIHPNPQGVSLIVEHIGPSVEALINRVTQ